MQNLAPVRPCWNLLGTTFHFLVSVLLTLPLHPFHVLYQQIFSSQLLVVQEVVHMLMRIQMHLVKGGVNPIFVAPQLKEPKKCSAIVSTVQSLHVSLT